MRNIELDTWLQIVKSAGIIHDTNLDDLGVAERGTITV